MRRNEQDLASQPVRNTTTNPAMVTKTSGTDILLTNYAPNPDFTGDIVTMGNIGGSPASWTSTTFATDRAHSGTRSFKLATCTVAGQAGRKQMLNPITALKVQKGQKVSWSCWIFSTVAGTISPYWEGKKVSDNTYTGGGAASVTVAANQWTYVSGTHTLSYESYIEGAGAYGLAVNIGDSVWFDDFCITVTDTPQAYFDGATPASNGYTYSWSGTAYNSASVRKASAMVVRTNLVANPSLKGGSLANIRTNVLTNPSFESATGTVDVWTNNVMNPSFRATSGTVEVRKNLALNPSFEATSGTPTVKTNLVTYPNFEVAGSSQAIRTNYSANPSMETTGSAAVVRTNLAHDPRATAANDTNGRMGWRTSRWFGGGSGAGTHTFITGAGDGPVSGLTTYIRKTWTVAGNTNGDTGFEHSFGGVNGLPATSGTSYTVSSYLRATGVSKSGGAIQVNFYDAAGALLTATGGTGVALPSGTWVRLSYNVTAPANTAFMHVISDVDSGTLWAPGEYLDGTGLLVEATGSALPYFDGSTTASENLTYAWTGTANVSTSEQRGVNVSLRTGLPPNGTSWQSTTRSRTGTKSAAVLVKYSLADNSTVWYPAGDYSAGTAEGQIPANTEVTWSVYVYIPTGSAAKVGLMEVTSGIRGTASADLFDQWQRISMTFTTPASGTFFLRLRTVGTTNTSGTTFWVDDEMIEAGPQPRPYFDTTNPDIQNLCTNPSFAVNTTGWSPISSTLTRVTDQGGDGHACEIAQTASGGIRNTAIWLIGSDYIAGSYSVSFDMKGIDASFTNVRAFLYDTETGLVRAQATTPLIKDGNFNRYTFSLTADGVFDKVYIEAQGVGIPIGTKVWLDRALVEKTSTPSPTYYEGTGDFTYAWSGTANASSSIKQATAFSGWAQLGSIYRSTLDPKMGTYSGAITTLGRNGDGIWPGTDMDVIAGRTYTYSVWIKATSAHSLTAGFRWKDASLAIIGADTNVVVTSQLVVGSWALVSATATAPALAAKLQLMLRIYETHTPTTFYLDGAICAESMVPVPYFDGATAASGDFTYAWTGVAGSSTSLQRGVGVTENAVLNVVPISSAEWKGFGSKSIRLIPNLTHTTDSFTAVSGDTGALRMGMVAGRTYTVSATIRLAAPQTGTLSTRSRKIVFFHKSPADPFHIETPSAQAANVAGETRLSVTVTIPDTATEAFVRLYNGASAGNGDVWWDNLLVEESTALKPYFDATVPAVENLVKTAPTALSNTTHTTGISYSGSTWTRSAVTTSGVSLTRQYVDLASLRQGEIYTVGVTLANDQSTTQEVKLDWCDNGTATVSLTPGEIRRVVISTIRTSGYNDTFRFADIHVTASATEPRSILFKDWLIELGTTSGEYYTGTGDFTYAWSGTANASTSLQRATVVVGSLASKSSAVGYIDSRFFTYQSTDGTGKKFGRWLSPSGTPNSAWRVLNINNQSLNYVSIASGSTYTLVMRYRSSGWGASQTFTTAFMDATGANVVIGNSATIPLNTGWTEYRRTFTALINGLSTTNLYITLPQIPQATTDGIFDIAEWALVPGNYTGPFFDGASTPTSTDFTHVWNGIADASTSKITAPMVTGIGGNYAGRVSWQSNDGPVVGKKSIAIVAGVPNVDTFAQIPTPFAGETLGGRTFTVLATRKTTENFIASGADGRAWRPHWTVNKADGSTQSYQPSTVESTTAGIYNFKWTFTFASDVTTSAFFRLYNGSVTAGNVVWWDDLAIIEGAYIGGYFDGSNPEALRVNLIPSPTAVTGNGWFDAHGVATSFTVNNAGGPVGTAFARSTVTGTATGNNYFMVMHGSTNPQYWTPVVAGRTYTASLYLRVTMPNLTQQPHLRFRWKDSAGVTISDQPLVYTTGYVSGTWVRLSSTGVAPSNAAYCEVGGGYVSLDQSTITVGDTVDVSAALVEEGSTLGAYFDGSTLSGSGTSYTWGGSANSSRSIAYNSDFTYAWSGTANASTSYQKAPTVLNWNVETKLTSYVTSTGTFMVQVKEPNGAGGRSFIPFSAAGVGLAFVDGKKYTVRVRGKKLNSATGYRLAGAAGSVEIPLTTSMATYTLTFTSNANQNLYFEHPQSSNDAGAEYEYIMITEEGDPLSYFDGDTSGTEGLIHRWKGTPYASQSEQIGATVTGYSLEPNIRSWAMPWDGAMRTINISGTTHSLQTASDSMVSGRTYTALFRAKLYGSATNVKIYGITGTPTVTLTSSYAWYRITGVATDTRLYFSTNGAPAGSGFDMSHLMVVEGTYTGGYVDGSSYGARWDGTANASTSLGNPTSLESMAGKPLFTGTTAGTTVLDPAVVSDTSARTIYSIVDNTADIIIAGQAVALSYGITTLNDTIPNKYIIMRQQGDVGPFNNVLTRRTGGGGPVTPWIPSTGRHILIGGINDSGYLFSGFDKSALTIDNVAVAIPHEKIIIEANSAYHSHVITYIYAGFHNDAMRAEMIRLLSLKHNVPL